MPRTRWRQVYGGEWIEPERRRGHKIKCCDCGLVHVLNFRLVKHGNGHKIQYQAFRNERSTALARRARPDRKALVKP